MRLLPAIGVASIAALASASREHKKESCLKRKAPLRRGFSLPGAETLLGDLGFRNGARQFWRGLGA